MPCGSEFYTCCWRRFFASHVSDGSFLDDHQRPPPTVIADDQSIGSHTQLNVLGGGTVGNSFAAGAVAVDGSDIEVNISDGTVGHSFDAFSGSIVNIMGGSIGNGFSAEAGSVVNVSGGVTDNNFGVRGGRGQRLRGRND